METIRLDNTRFIFDTNLSGDPERDTYGSTTRYANIIIPDKDLALAMNDFGLNVKVRQPREEGQEPLYFIKAIAKYKSDGARRDPSIYLVADREPVLLDDVSLQEIDHARVKNVNAILRPYANKKTGRKSVYISVMYVEIDLENDPFAVRYRAE